MASKKSIPGTGSGTGRPAHQQVMTKPSPAPAGLGGIRPGNKGNGTVKGSTGGPSYGGGGKKGMC